jgi:hypothetical protein
MQSPTEQCPRPTNDFTSAKAALIREYIDYYEERSPDPISANNMGAIFYHMQTLWGGKTSGQSEIARDIYYRGNAYPPIELLRPLLGWEAE